MVSPLVQTARPTRQLDGNTPLTERNGAYGERLFVPAQPANGRQWLAEEGSYYIGCNPTISTAVAAAVNATYDSTKGFFVIQNTDDPSNGRRIFLDYLRMLVTVAPASGTQARFAIVIDQALRTPTAGQAEVTMNNADPRHANDFPGKVYSLTGGAVLTVPAVSAAARVVANGSLRQSIPIVLDELILQFGGHAQGATPVATVGRQVSQAGPVIIPPGCSAEVVIWFPSNAATGASFEFEVAAWAR